jgi:glycerol-3-phosphate dehydrogenase (NAD+)
MFISYSIKEYLDYCFQGFYVSKDHHVDLLSTVISRLLEIPCYVLMGANIASEVAAGTFCEATVGSRNYEHGQLIKGLIQTDEFRIVIKPDTEVIEVLGALKNIVAVAAGFSDGLGYGDNTKAAVIRLGLKEMVKFCEEFFPGLLLIDIKIAEKEMIVYRTSSTNIFRILWCC